MNSTSFFKRGLFFLWLILAATQVLAIITSRHINRDFSVFIYQLITDQSFPVDSLRYFSSYPFIIPWFISKGFRDQEMVSAIFLTSGFSILFMHILSLTFCTLIAVQNNKLELMLFPLASYACFMFLFVPFFSSQILDIYLLTWPILFIFFVSDRSKAQLLLVLFLTIALSLTHELAAFVLIGLLVLSIKQKMSWVRYDRIFVFQLLIFFLGISFNVWQIVAHESRPGLELRSFFLFIENLKLLLFSDVSLAVSFFTFLGFGLSAFNMSWKFLIHFFLASFITIFLFYKDFTPSMNQIFSYRFYAVAGLLTCALLFYRTVNASEALNTSRAKMLFAAAIAVTLANARDLYFTFKSYQFNLAAITLISEEGSRPYRFFSELKADYTYDFSEPLTVNSILHQKKKTVLGYLTKETDSSKREFADFAGATGMWYTDDPVAIYLKTYPGKYFEFPKSNSD